MRKHTLQFLVPHLLGALAAGSALGCGLAAGGQSFDDGSDGLGHGRRVEADPSTRGIDLEAQPRLSITTSGRREPSSGIPPSTSLVGDLDADGYSDFVVVGYGPQWEKDLPRAFVFYGRAEFPEQLDLADADFVISGINSLLQQVTRLGDFNGDGFDDFAFSGEGGDGTSRHVDLVLGSAQRPSGAIAARSLETAFSGEPPRSELELMGTLQGPGDVNGDGYADLLVSTSAGSALVLGRAEPYGQTPLLGNTAGMFSLGLDGAGPVVGDLDRDGYADVLLGYAALYYGRPDGWSSSLEHIEPDAVFKGAVRSVGDRDGDGYVDLARLASTADRRDDGSGPIGYQIQISYGGPERYSGKPELQFPGPHEELYGLPMLALGDVNGDRRDDLVLGSPQQVGGAGAVFLVPGDTGSRTEHVQVNAAEPGLLGYVDDGWSENLGQDVSSLGDVNGDGYQDILIGRGRGYDDTLRAVLVFGGPDL